MKVYYIKRKEIFLFMTINIIEYKIYTDSTNNICYVIINLKWKKNAIFQNKKTKNFKTTF